MPIATSDALMGFGTPAQLANLMGANPKTTAGIGTTQSGAAPILSRNTEMTASAGATAGVLPAGVGVMEPYFISNVATSTAALVYVPLGHTVGGNLNGSVSVPQFKGVIMWQYKPKFWVAIVSA